MPRADASLRFRLASSVRAAQSSAASFEGKDLHAVGYPTTRTIASQLVLPSPLRRLVKVAVSAVSGLVGASHREETAENCREIAERLWRPFCNFLINLVAGEGFEPSTFGL